MTTIIAITVRLKHIKLSTSYHFCPTEWYSHMARPSAMKDNMVLGEHTSGGSRDGFLEAVKFGMGTSWLSRGEAGEGLKYWEQPVYTGGSNPR